jgi:hypothetical protein
MSAGNAKADDARSLMDELKWRLSAIYRRSEHHRDFGQTISMTLDFIDRHNPDGQAVLTKLAGVCRLSDGRVAILTRTFGRLLAGCAHQDHDSAAADAKRSKIGRSNLNNSLKISGFTKVRGARENADARAELRRKVGTMAQREARNWSIRIDPRFNAPVVDSADNVVRVAPPRDCDQAEEAQPVAIDGLFNCGFDSGWDPFTRFGEEWPSFW